MTSSPTFLPERVRHVWNALAGPDVPDPSQPTSDLPDIVSRWLGRVAPRRTGHPRGVCLEMHGEIRLGKWRPFRARQILSPDGFIWAAEAGRFPMKVSGYDMYTGDSGELNWRLFGLVPVMSQADDDVTRSAAGRLAAELLVLTPFNSRAGMFRWSQEAPAEAIATVTTGRFIHRVSMRIDEDGRLTDLSLPRWGDPDNEGFREETFGVVFHAEDRFDDYVLPSSFTAGWRMETDQPDQGEFFRGTIDDAGFF